MPKIFRFKQGQQTIIGLVLIFVMGLILSAFTPTIVQYSNTAAGNMTDAMHATVVRLVPLFVWLCYIITIFVYTQTFRPQ